MVKGSRDGRKKKKKGFIVFLVPLFSLFLFFVIIIGGEGIQTLVLLIRGTGHCH